MATATQGSTNHKNEIAALKRSWAEDARWRGIERPYTAEDVIRLRGSVQIEYTLARRGDRKSTRLNSSH